MKSGSRRAISLALGANLGIAIDLEPDLFESD